MSTPGPRRALPAAAKALKKEAYLTSSFGFLATVAIRKFQQRCDSDSAHRYGSIIDLNGQM